MFGGQKRWIFLAVLGSPGKGGNNRTLEAVGSTPIGSTSFMKGRVIHPPLFCGIDIINRL
jgi:hypothetical protein